MPNRHFLISLIVPFLFQASPLAQQQGTKWGNDSTRAFVALSQDGKSRLEIDLSQVDAFYSLIPDKDLCTRYRPAARTYFTVIQIPAAYGKLDGEITSALTDSLFKAEEIGGYLSRVYLPAHKAGDFEISSQELSAKTCRSQSPWSLAGQIQFTERATHPRDHDFRFRAGDTREEMTDYRVAFVNGAFTEVRPAHVQTDMRWEENIKGDSGTTPEIVSCKNAQIKALKALVETPVGEKKVLVYRKFLRDILSLSKIKIITSVNKTQAADPEDRKRADERFSLENLGTDLPKRAAYEVTLASGGGTIRTLQMGIVVTSEGECKTLSSLELNSQIDELILARFRTNAEGAALLDEFAGETLNEEAQSP